MKKSISNIVEIFISLVILAIIVFSINLEKIKTVEFHFSYELLTKIIIFFLISLFSRSYRFRYLMNQNAVTKISQLASFKFMFVGAALNMILPSGMGDIARSYFGYKWSGVKERMLSVSIFDKAVAFSSLTFLAVFSIFFTNNYLFILAIFFCAVPLLTILFLETLLSIRIIKKVIDYINNKSLKLDLSEFIKHITFSPIVIINSTIISILGWIFSYVLLFYTLKVVNIDVDFLKLMAVCPALTIGRTFPFTFNGIGSDEVLFIFIFRYITNASTEELLIGALLYRLIFIILPAIPGLMYILFTKKMDISNR